LRRGHGSEAVHEFVRRHRFEERKQIWSRTWIWVLHIQWNLCDPTPEFSDILWLPTRIPGPKIFL
jgi:hypothetical protein